MRIGQRLWRPIREYQPLWDSLSLRRRRQLFGLLLLSLLSAGAEVGNLGALLPFLKLLADPVGGLSSLGPWAQPLVSLARPQLLLVLGGAFLAMVTVSAALRVATTYSQLKLTALLGADLGRQVLGDVLQRPYAWHLRQNSAETLGILTKDVDIVVTSLQSLLGLVINGLIAVLLTGALIALAPGVMVGVTLLLAAFYGLVYRFTRGTLADDGLAQTRNYQVSLQMAQEALGGIRDLLLDRSQAVYLQRYDRANREFRRAIQRINTKAQVPRYLIESFAMALIAGVALVLALQGDGIATILPLLGTLALGAYRLLQPAQQCFNTFSTLKANQAAWQRVRTHLGHRALPLAAPLGSPAVAAAPRIELRQVSFRYGPEDPWVLQDLSLSIPAGARVALVGSTGSGKSTTLDLILGLLVPEQGQVRVNGADLQADPYLRERWQRQLAHVPQQIYLSDGSFAENIAFGIKPEAIDRERVQQAAWQACLAELIEQQPRGYDSVVGERGIRLSGGQRQRLGIARALYRQASLLVLDEATSALDNRTEAAVMQSLSDLGRPLTVVMIAHRLSTVQHCDCIFLLEQGQLRARGTYRELLATSDAFRRLARAEDQNQ